MFNKQLIKMSSYIQTQLQSQSFSSKSTLAARNQKHSQAGLSLTRQTSSVGNLIPVNRKNSDIEISLQVVGDKKQLDERRDSQPESETPIDPNKDVKLASKPYMHSLLPSKKPTRRKSIGLVTQTESSEGVYQGILQKQRLESTGKISQAEDTVKLATDNGIKFGATAIETLQELQAESMGEKLKKSHKQMRQALQDTDPLSRSIIDLAAVSKIKDLPLNESKTSRQHGIVKTQQQMQSKGFRGSGLSTKKSETLLPALMKPSDKARVSIQSKKGSQSSMTSRQFPSNRV